MFKKRFFAALWLMCLAWPLHASAQGVFFTTQQVLNDFFSSSERVSYERVDTQTPEMAQQINALLGERLKRAVYVVFVATTGERVDGYAVIDEEQGQHQPITFAVKVGVDGRIERTEIMVYREGYGDEIREARFRRQFVGKGVGAPLRLGQDIAAISGATISSKAMSRAVRRAVALVALVRGRHATASAQRAGKTD